MSPFHTGRHQLSIVQSEHVPVRFCTGTIVPVLILLLLLPSVALSADSRIRANVSPVRRPMLVGDFDTLIPQFVDGAGWQTTILLTNLTNHTAYFAIFFSADSGELTEFPI